MFARWLCNCLQTRPDEVHYIYKGQSEYGQGVCISSVISKLVIENHVDFYVECSFIATTTATVIVAGCSAFCYFSTSTLMQLDYIWCRCLGARFFHFISVGQRQVAVRMTQDLLSTEFTRSLDKIMLHEC
jgi:hypothetical protein